MMIKTKSAYQDEARKLAESILPGSSERLIADLTAVIVEAIELYLDQMVERSR